MNKVIITLLLVSNFETLLTIAEAAGPKAPKCVAAAATSYERLDPSQKQSYGSIMSITGASGQTVYAYYQKLLAEFDLFNLKAPVTIQLDSREKAVVTVEKENGVKVLTFNVNNGAREITVAEKSFYEVMKSKLIDDLGGLSKGSQLYAISQRYLGSGVDVALKKLAEVVSGDSKRVNDLYAEFAKAYEQVEIDYMMIQKLPEVVLKLEKFLQNKKFTPTAKELERFKQRVGNPDFMRTWIIGDQSHQITYATKGQSRLLHIWTSTGEGIGLETAINLNTFDPQNPVFNFKSSQGTNQLQVRNGSFEPTWSKQRNEESEEIRIVFNLELFKQKIDEEGGD